jgi:hypothetical protein
LNSPRRANGAKITLKGELAAKREGSYHLRLAIATWVNEKNNSTENYELDMVPGEAQQRGFVSSFVFHRLILINPADK